MLTAEPGCAALVPLFAYLESKLNCVLQKLSRKICGPYGRHHLNDEKHPYAFRTGKGGNSGLSRSVTYRPGHDSGLPPARSVHRLRLVDPRLFRGAPIGRPGVSASRVSRTRHSAPSDSASLP